MARATISLGASSPRSSKRSMNRDPSGSFSRPPLAPDRFRDQKGFGVGVIQACWVELIEFHVRDTASCPPRHGNPVSGGTVRIRCIAIGLGGTTGSNHRESCPEQLHMVVFKIQDIGTDTSVSRQRQFAIGDQVDCHPSRHELDVRTRLCLGRQKSLKPHGRWHLLRE